MTLYLGELPQVVECSQSVQLLQRQDQSLMRRWVHEVKVNQVIDACKENVSSYWTVTSTKESSNVFQRHNLNVWTDIILIVLSASTPHLNSSAEGLHFPSWSSESQGQSFPPSHVWRPRLCKAWNISQQPLCQHDPLSGWLKPEHKKKTHSMIQQNIWRPIQKLVLNYHLVDVCQPVPVYNHVRPDFGGI